MYKVKGKRCVKVYVYIYIYINKPLKGNLSVGQDLEVKTSTGKTFTCVVRLDTEPEVAFWRNGGILNYVLRKMA